MEFKLNMSLSELKKRTSPTHYKPIKFLSEDSREYKKLKSNEKLTLMHLTRAAAYFDTINLKLENHHNIEFLQFLKEQVAKGDRRAQLSLKMFLSQKSMFSPDSLGNQTSLVFGAKKPLGLGFYPEDLSSEEFCEIIEKMLDMGKTEEVKKILSQRTVVVRDKDLLKAVDFVDALPEFSAVADELEKAKETCQNKKFENYLFWQIRALKKADAKADAKADKIWATLDARCPYEFTITRECYGENMTKSVLENDALKARLKSLGIEVYTKDCLGARVGIVNKRGTRLLKKLKNLIKISAENMPYKNEYSNDFEGDGNAKQTAVDVDLVTLTGDEGAYRASIVLAQNLPNDDKMSVKEGGGRRNVYHRQVRKNVNKKLYKNLITESQFKYFSPEADHWAVICHENTHSLGPKSHSVLGAYSSILEEFKADMGMYAFLREFADAGFFDENQIRQIIVTSLSGSFVKGKPSLEEAHRTREVMICNRMIDSGAITFDADKKLVFDFEKAIKTAKEMMSEVVRLQLDADIFAAKKYVEKWFVWSNQLEGVAEILRRCSKKLNGYLIEPLADAMKKPDFEKSI